MARPVLTVFSRRGCHLCEVLIGDLAPLIRGNVELKVCDIDTRDDWRREFDLRVPVVEFAGEVVCEGRLDKDKIRSLIQQLASTSRS